jgi:hypothetical protein
LKAVAPLGHDPSELFYFARSQSIPTGGIDCLSILVPGILTQSVQSLGAGVRALT